MDLPDAGNIFALAFDCEPDELPASEGDYDPRARKDAGHAFRQSVCERFFKGYRQDNPDQGIPVSVFHSPARIPPTWSSGSLRAILSLGYARRTLSPPAFDHLTKSFSEVRM